MNYDIEMYYTKPSADASSMTLFCVSEEDAKALAIILSRYDISISMTPLILTLNKE